MQLGVHGMTMEVKQAEEGGEFGAAVVCTLFEGDYHFGLAALINSLVRSGYRGEIIAGYRGALPPWLEQLARAGNNGRYEVAAGVCVEFIPLDTAIHFAHFKPQFMQQLLAERVCDYLCYIDPDIVINWPWSFYRDWIRHGVALCEDVSGPMPPDHPIRLKWLELAAPLGLKDPRPLSRYYNSGFVGVAKKHSGWLQLWQSTMRIAEAEGLDTSAWSTGDRTNPFFMADQDALNMAAMFPEYPLTTLGREGMGFAPGGAAMYHAAGVPKPWRKKMLRCALSGLPPSHTEKAYLAHVSGPIRCYSDFALTKKRISCAVGALIGRFYHRR